MKVIVLENEVPQRTLIRAALDKGRHELVLADTPDDIVRMIKAGQGRFIIADESAMDRSIPDFVRLLRGPDLPSTFVLILASGVTDLVDADDLLKKPFASAELAARVLIAQRFLSLGDSLARARQQIENMALFDAVTGLMNRTAFLRMAQGELERARRASAPLSIIALDIDNLAELQKLHGEPLGEEVLKVVAQSIREKSRPYDCIGRWSGEGFVLALPNVIGEDAKKIAERIIKGIRSAPAAAGEQVVVIDASAGISAVLRITASTEVEPLIQQAQQAMLRAKESGGDEVNLIYA